MLGWPRMQASRDAHAGARLALATDLARVVSVRLGAGAVLGVAVGRVEVPAHAHLLAPLACEVAAEGRDARARLCRGRQPALEVCDRVLQHAAGHGVARSDGQVGRREGPAWGRAGGRGRWQREGWRWGTLSTLVRGCATAEGWCRAPPPAAPTYADGAALKGRLLIPARWRKRARRKRSRRRSRCGRRPQGRRGAEQQV